MTDIVSALRPKSMPVIPRTLAMRPGLYPELFQSVPEGLAPLGEGGLYDPYEEVMVAEGNCRSIAHREGGHG